MAEDRQGNVWANFGLETAVFRRQTDGSYLVDKTALLRFSDMAVAKIYAEDDGIVWFGRDDGLVRFDPSVQQNYTTDYSALVRRVTLEDGRLLHGGATDQDCPPAVPRLHPADNALRFEYASTWLASSRETHYQTMLEGFDPKWSAWTAESRRDYTNLPPGSYRFRVRARNLYQHESAEAGYALVILGSVVRHLVGLPGVRARVGCGGGGARQSAHAEAARREPPARTDRGRPDTGDPRTRVGGTSAGGRTAAPRRNRQGHQP